MNIYAFICTRTKDVNNVTLELLNFLNTNNIKDSRAEFIQRLLEVSDSRKSLRIQDSEITTHSIYHKIDPGLRIALNNNIVTLLTIDNELIDLKVMYEFLIENCENE
jgi:hypothetical protein